MSTYPAGAAPPAAVGAPRSQRPVSLLRYAKFTDPAALLAWVFLTSVPSEGALPALARYMVVAYVAAGLIIFNRDTLPAYLRGWPTLILPILCIVSTIWAPSSNEAIRKGLQLALTGAVAIYAASRLNARQIIAIYYIGETFGAVLSVMSPNVFNGAWTGVFAQKNYLAVHMFILYATGLVIMLDSGASKWLRMSTACFVPLAAMLIFLSHSATTLLLLIGASFALVGHVFFWQPITRVRHMRVFIILSITLILVVVSLLLFGLFQFDAANSLLNALGKDSTLTGRTFLWNIAERIMTEKPWTGVGANGFWRPELGAANEITTYFAYEHFVKFGFHNSFLENGVQFGYPGYYATYFIAGWALWSTFRTWIKNQTLLNAAFLVLCVMVIVRANTETDLAVEFSGTAVLLFIGAVRKEKLRPRRTRMPTPPVAPERGQAVPPQP
jgi:exopolysaccharide production protein ExoQ